MGVSARPGAPLLEPARLPVVREASPVLEWDDGARLEEEIRRYEVEKLALRSLSCSWRAITAGVLLLPLMLLPPLIPAAGEGIAALGVVSAFLGSAIAVVGWAASLACAEDVERQRERLDMQAGRVQDQLERVDPFLDV